MAQVTWIWVTNARGNLAQREIPLTESNGLFCQDGSWTGKSLETCAVGLHLKTFLYNPWHSDEIVSDCNISLDQKWSWQKSPLLSVKGIKAGRRRGWWRARVSRETYAAMGNDRVQSRMAFPTYNPRRQNLASSTSIGRSALRLVDALGKVGDGNLYGFHFAGTKIATTARYQLTVQVLVLVQVQSTWRTPSLDRSHNQLPALATKSAQKRPCTAATAHNWGLHTKLRFVSKFKLTKSEFCACCPLLVTRSHTPNRSLSTPKDSQNGERSRRNCRPVCCPLAVPMLTLVKLSKR